MKYSVTEDVSYIVYKQLEEYLLHPMFSDCFEILLKYRNGKVFLVTRHNI